MIRSRLMSAPNRRAEDLPAEQGKQDVGDDTDAERPELTERAEVPEPAEDQQDQHDDPEDETACHGLSFRVNPAVNAKAAASAPLINWFSRLLMFSQEALPAMTLLLQ